MMDRVEVAKRFIEETRKELRQEERQGSIIAKFEELFGFLPDWIEWKTDCMEKVLEAKARVEEEELEKKTILGEKVKEVCFYIIEDPLIKDIDINWKFSQFTKGGHNVYKFIKRLRGYIAKVEVLTK